MLQGRLQLLDALDHQLTERPAEESGAAAAERPGGVRVDHGRAEVDVDEHHAPGRVLQECLAQRDGPLQVDLGVHLAERAVHPGRLAVGAQHPGGLGAHQHPAAVLAQQRELVDLAPRRVHGGHEPPLHLVRVGPAHRPPREPRTPHGLLRGPAEDALGLAVPVGDGAARVEGAEGRVHAVEQGGEQLGPGVGGGSPGTGGGRSGAHGLPRVPGIDGPAGTGTRAAAGATSGASRGPLPGPSSGPSASVVPLLLEAPTPYPPQNVLPFPRASPRVLLHVRPFNSNVTQRTSHFAK
ncbi:hypothetical protein SMICM17S_04570 [Streptomyces microflavus]